MTNKETEFKPCPFIFKGCSSGKVEPIFQHGADAFFVNCSGCGARGPITESLDMAVAAWNTRAATQSTDAQRRELLDHMRCQVVCSDKATMPIPLYERIKTALQDPALLGGEEG